jgi:hypothetical protein
LISAAPRRADVDAMTEFTLTSRIPLPVGLGLIGLIEPCSIGSTLIVMKHPERNNYIF